MYISEFSTEVVTVFTLEQTLSAVELCQQRRFALVYSPQKTPSTHVKSPPLKNTEKDTTSSHLSKYIHVYFPAPSNSYSQAETIL